ncbi:MAG TPA: 3-methyl-2-oxobutanoate hydroxymethyltransferase [Planctomycetes bacterium]|nr:3-methyl-2-oxobutanoate hydroxymethyltransferase [Planctomycetota bacterium]
MADIAELARIVDDAGIDSILVGDSLGMVIGGQDNTLEVSLEEVAYHCRAVRRGAPHPFLIADMPFMTYQASVEEAVRNAGFLLRKGRAEAVKLEGGEAVLPQIRAITAAGIPVCAQVGLTPQSVHAMGGFKVQGRAEASAERVFLDARAVVDAGAFMVVLEGIPQELAARITADLAVPTIGIGAGVGCDGQVLVCSDLLGMNPSFQPRFVRQFADGYGIMRGAFESYAKAVGERSFPSESESFSSPAVAPLAKRPLSSG